MAYKNAWYAERKAAGMCIDLNCSKRADAGFTRCFSCRAYHNQKTIESYHRLRKRVFEMYGGAKCKCCGETEYDFLTLEHDNGGGCEHRRQLGNVGILHWLRRQGYPAGYSVLCMNCNWGSKNGKICPHKRSKTYELDSLGVHSILPECELHVCLPSPIFRLPSAPFQGVNLFEFNLDLLADASTRTYARWAGRPTR